MHSNKYKYAKYYLRNSWDKFGQFDNPGKDQNDLVKICFMTQSHLKYQTDAVYIYIE